MILNEFKKGQDIFNELSVLLAKMSVRIAVRIGLFRTGLLVSPSSWRSNMSKAKSKGVNSTLRHLEINEKNTLARGTHWLMAFFYLSFNGRSGFPTHSKLGNSLNFIKTESPYYLLCSITPKVINYM